MDDGEAGVAWQALNLNWLPVLSMGGVLLGAIACTDFSLEPAAFGSILLAGRLLEMLVFKSTVGVTERLSGGAVLRYATGRQAPARQ
jgi:hypothetical protein